MVELRGFPIVYGAEARIGDTFIETIVPGAYHPTRQADVVLLVGHDAGKPLARTSARSLVLLDEARGVHASAFVDERVTFAHDAIYSIRSQAASGASFAFYTLDDTWSLRNGTPYRELLSFSLIEISTAVTFPAYTKAGFSVVQRSQTHAGPRRTHVDRQRDDSAWRLRIA